MTLEEELARRRRRVAETLAETDLRTIDEAVARLEMLQLAETSLQVGDVLPDFALPDAMGQVVASDELLDRAPVVLGFFRGSWCPYCDAAFRAMEAARPEIEAAGGLLVGVCPETPDQLRRTIDEYGIRYPLLSDRDSGFARLCGLRWEVSDPHAEFLGRRGVDLPARHGTTEWALPLPATYVFDRAGVIRFIHARADWRRRAEPAELVACVRRLAKGG